MAPHFARACLPTWHHYPCARIYRMHGVQPLAAYIPPTRKPSQIIKSTHKSQRTTPRQRARYPLFFEMDTPSSSSDRRSYGYHPSSFTETQSDRMTHSDDGVILASAQPKKPAGRTKFTETRHPVYRGVRMRNPNKWVCEVREPNKKTRIWLGTYPTAEMAARAHDVAALALRGNQACLNFADSVWRLPAPVSNDAGDIRKAAAEAAEAFRPGDMEVDGGNERRDVNDDKGSDGASDGEGTAAGVEMQSYVDEEAVFYMPRLISDMAEGMLIPPPRCLGGWSSDDVGSPHADVSLWNFTL